MKKLISIILTLGIVVSAFAQDKSPAMLKQKQFFDKPELFEAVEIYTNPQANLELIKEYETNPAAFKPEQLIPVINCYMVMKNSAAAKKALESFLVVRPKYVKARNLMGTLSLLSNDADAAVENFKVSYEAGDKGSVKRLASAYIIGKKTSSLKPYVDELKTLAKTDLEALNILLIYAIDGKEPNTALFKEVLKNADTLAILRGASLDSLLGNLRIYLARRDIWVDSALVIPARAAALSEMWLQSLQAYEQALKANPKDVMALRGLALVYYRTGDVQKAIDSIKAAISAGDKTAASDGVELAIISTRADIWNEFKDKISGIRIAPAVRAGMVQYANSRDGYADMFYAACEGDGSEPLFKDKAVMNLIGEALKKYGTDPRAAALKTKYDNASKDLKK